MKFYLGVHRPQWLFQEPLRETLRDVPLFVSHARLKGRKSAYPPAITDWALDSGGFSELTRNHRWVETPEAYVESVYRYRDELGRLQWASPQDWMCEPVMLERTGFSVETHQRLTVENYLTLVDMAPDLPFVPVVQGWELDDYLRCVEMYAEAGVDLAALPLVGVGSVCRRQSTAEIGEVFSALHGAGLSTHGYGVKGAGVKRYGHLLQSSDSMAWSYGARRSAPTSGCDKKNCANCLHYALEWRDRLLDDPTLVA